MSVKRSPTGLFHLFKRFLPQIRQERKLLAISLAGLIGEVTMRLLEPWPLKWVIDRVLDPGQKGASPHPLLQSTSPLTLVTIAAVAVVVIGGLRALAAYANTIGLALVGNRILTQVRADLYRHMQALSLAYHARARSGELIVRVINDVGMFGVMLWLDYRLALVALATLPLFWLRTMTLTRRLRHVAREQRKREGAMAATAAESISAIRVVKALSLEDRFSSSFSAQNSKSLRDGAKAKRLEASLERTVDALIALSSALVLWYGARLALSGAITAGALVVFLTYLKNAFKPVRDFAKYTGRLTKASAAAERVLEVLDEAPELQDDPAARVAPAFSGNIELQRVRFGYEPGVEVLRGIDIEIAPGERVAIVGESGAGKSTIASLLLRLYDATKGRILIDGHDIRSFTIRSLRQRIAVVLQDTLLFAGTIRDNISIGTADLSEEQIVEAARLARADEFIRLFPNAYDTTVGERGVTLSSGQRQRIAIARAAVRNTPILLLDEPTTGLDEENRAALSDAIDLLSRSRTTLLITHDLSLARIADRILVLENGVIVECGSHSQLMAFDGRYASMYRSQMSETRYLASARHRSALTA